jgi:hypothetical protein
MRFLPGPPLFQLAFGLSQPTQDRQHQSPMRRGGIGLRSRARTGNLVGFFEGGPRLEQVIVVSYAYNQQMLEKFRRGNHER